MLNALLTLAGGLGLFLLGLLLMTEGLRTGAGHTLSATLHRATETPLKAFFAGLGLTALLQSSSVVTVMLLGFLEAGLLNLYKSIWVVYGTNVGTTFTAWLVATIGLKVDVIAGALPLVALGTALRLFFGPVHRGGAWGTALAGLGLLFLGLEYMQRAFSGHVIGLELPQLEAPGIITTLAYVAFGALITALIQSSSATTAIILSALAAGSISWEHAAPMAIGANIGTTVTALLAAIGASPVARRLAMAHLIFNVVTALAALVILPMFLMVVRWLTETLEGYDDPLVQLAAFHTLFNVFGVILLWPWTSRLARWLNHLFKNERLDRWQPPTLSLPAETLPEGLIALLDQHTRAAGHNVLSLAQEILQGNATARQDELAAARKYLEQLEMDMIELIQRLPESQQDIRAIRYIHMLHEYFQLLGWLESWQREMQAYQPTPWLKQEVERLEQSVRAFLQLVDPTQALTPLGEEELNQTYTKIKRAYEEFKRGVYARLRHHELQVEQMESLIARANYARLIALTARKAYHWMNAKIDELAPPETDINGEKKEKN